MSGEQLFFELDTLGLGATVRGFVPGIKLYDRFVLQRVLSWSELGVAWVAHDEATQSNVVLKFLPERVRFDTASMEQIVRETHRSAALLHPHIARTFDFHIDPTSAAIASEYVEGLSLAVWREHQPTKIFEAQQLHEWTMQWMDALDYAHLEIHLVHGALKPTYLIIDEAGSLKITDFGTARVIEQAVGRLNKLGTPVGSLVYMSPQQAAGGEPTPSDDIYSFGATLYALITGQPPFSGESNNVLAQIREVDPRSMTRQRAKLGTKGARIALPWEETVAACLAKDPAQRPHDIANVAERLGFKVHPVGEAAPEPRADVPPHADISVVSEPLPSVPEPAPNSVVAETVAPITATPTLAPPRLELPRTQPLPTLQIAPAKAISQKIDVDPAKSPPATPLPSQVAPPASVAPAPSPASAPRSSPPSLAPNTTPRSLVPAPTLASAKPAPKSEAKPEPPPVPAVGVSAAKVSSRKLSTPELLIILALVLIFVLDGLAYFYFSVVPTTEIAKQVAIEAEKQKNVEAAARAVADGKIAELEKAKKDAEDRATAAEQAAEQAKSDADKAKQTAAATMTKMVTALGPSPGVPWVNSLGVKFVPAGTGNILVSIWDVRVKDYAAFVAATNHEWIKPAFAQTGDEPVVHVSWDDAHAFCDWLTKKEQNEGRLTSSQGYRLPSDMEWSKAAGLDEPGSVAPPKDKNGVIKNIYPWGTTWPPPKGAGNYAELLTGDTYEKTSPVGSFNANPFGLFDMGGNVWQWCEDKFDYTHDWRVLRGNSYVDRTPESLLSSVRSGDSPDARDDATGFRLVVVVVSE